MRRVAYIVFSLVALFVVAWAPTTSSAQTQRTIVQRTLPDTLSRTYRHTEAVKRMTVHSDTLGAMTIWREIVAEDSTYAPALYNLSLYEAGDCGLEMARRAYLADTTNKWYTKNLASKLITTGRYSQAIPVYKRLMRLAPKDLEPYHALTILYSYSRMPYSAISVLDSAELRIGYNPYLHEMKHGLLLETRQLDKAIEASAKVVVEQPYNTKAHIYLSEAYEAAGRDSLARAVLDKAFAVDSTSFDVLSAIAGYYERAGDIRRMLSYEQRILQDGQMSVEQKLQRVKMLTSDMQLYRDNYIQIGSIIQSLAIAYPNNRQVVDCYSEHLLALGDYDNALDLMRRHLQNEATAAEHYIEVLQLEHYLGREELIEEDIDEAFERYPNDLSIISFAGFLAIESQNNEEAVEIFKHGLEVATDDQQRSEMLGYIGDMYHEMGRDAKAFKLYRKALEYNPENVLVLNNYAYFLSLRDKDLKRALAMAEEAMRLEPNNASYIDTYAWVLHRMGDNAKAKTVMSQALSQSAQRDASLLAHYGDILWALGEKFMAETYWQKAVDRGFDKDAMQQHVDEIKSKTKTK